MCAKQGTQQHLRFFHVNINEAVYKCNSSTCLYPFRNFIYKNFTDNTVYRYERIRMCPTLCVPQLRPDSQIVPHVTGDISPSADYYNNNDRTLHAQQEFRVSIRSDDTTQSSSDSYSTGSYENYSLDMFSLENLLALSSSVGDAKITSTSSDCGSIIDDCADDNTAFGMDCIDDIIDDICKTADYCTETDFDCTDLAKYIDGSPTKSSEFVTDNASPVIVRPQKPAGVTFSFAPNQSPTSSTAVHSSNKPILISSVTLPNKFVPVMAVNMAKPADSQSATACRSSVQRATTNTSKRKPVPDNKTKKASRSRKDTTDTEFKQLLRKKCDVTHKFQAFVENKDKFRPLDLLHSFYTMQLNNGRQSAAAVRPPRVSKPTPAQQQKPTVPSSCNRILVKEECPTLPASKTERLDEFNEMDIKQNIIFIKPKRVQPDEIERKPVAVDVKPDTAALPYRRKKYLRIKAEPILPVTRIVFPCGNVHIKQ